MLTKKQNLIETMKGGSPDRFVKQFEFMEQFWADPIVAAVETCDVLGPGSEAKDVWGVTWRWPEGTPGPFPVHEADYKVLKDVTKWKEVVKLPNMDYPQEAWDAFRADVEAVDRNEQYVAWGVFPGVFELLHSLMGMDDCLMNLYEEPEAMHELIDFITDYYCKYAKLICDHYHPDALYHHDDWGSQISSFMSPEMFGEFIVPAFKKIYQTWRDNGVELIVHHSDSYAANLIPQMIEIGIDIWQGCLTTNDVPSLVKKYGKQITFMGDLNSGVLDTPDWTKELVEKEVRRACESNGKLYFIPNLTQGGPVSTFPEVYPAVDEAIDAMSKEMFQ